MEFLALLVSSTLKIFAMMTPPAVLAAFLGAARQYSQERRRSIALRVSLAAFIIGITLYLLGNYIFSIFNISLDSFRIGAGTLLFLTAVSLMKGGLSQDSYPEGTDFSIVPLAIPLCMGPATIGIIMVWGATKAPWPDKLAEGLAVALASAGIYLMLRLSSPVERLLGQTGISVMAKLTGLLLAAIAAQMIFTGIRHFFS